MIRRRTAQAAAKGVALFGGGVSAIPRCNSSANATPYRAPRRVASSKAMAASPPMVRAGEKRAISSASDGGSESPIVDKSVRKKMGAHDDLCARALAAYAYNHAWRRREAIHL